MKSPKKQAYIIELQGSVFLFFMGLGTGVL